MTQPIPPIPPLDIDAIRARAEAATPGPWRSVDLRHQRGGQIRIFARGSSYLANVLARGDNPTADAEFVAAARTDVPALLDLLAERDAEIKRLRDQLDAAGIGPARAGEQRCEVAR